MKVRLNPELEHAVIRAIADGIVRPSTVSPDELSPIGQTVLGAIKALFKSTDPPLKLEPLFFNCVEHHALDQEEGRTYFRALKNLPSGPEMDALVRRARDKKMLSDLIQEAGDQLAGDFNAAKLGKILDRHALTVAPLVPLEQAVGEVIPEPPVGLPLAGLPEITKETGGLMGYWVIGGEPGLGKSTLAWQIALGVQAEQPVIYYDLDATGVDWLTWRTMKIAGTRERFNELTRRLYLRASIRTLDDDLRMTSPPGLVVVDSLQTLPVWKDKRTSLDWWISRFKDLVHRGYTVLCVSEKKRDAYGEVGIGSFKETGAIEYAASLGAILSGEVEDPDGPVTFNIVKNRHRRKRGRICTLVRNGWWFSEDKEGFPEVGL